MNYISDYPATFAVASLTTFAGLHNDHSDIKKYISNLGINMVNGIIFGQLIDTMDGIDKCVPLITLLIFAAFMRPNAGKEDAMAKLTMANIFSFIYKHM